MIFYLTGTVLCENKADLNFKYDENISSTQIIFTENGHIYRMNPDGSNKRVVAAFGTARNPQISSDGSKIAFSAKRHRYEKRKIYDLEELEWPDYLDWSPEGDRIAFYTTKGLQIIDIATREIELITSSQIDFSWGIIK